MNKGRYTTISIPIQLKDHLKKRIKGTGFHSVSSYVTYVLRQLASANNQNIKGFTSEDEKKVRDRLRNLDYL